MSQTTPETSPDAPFPFVHYAERIRRAAAANPSLEVIKCEGEVRTWAEFLPRTNMVANMLNGRGLGRGDMVAVLARSSVEYLGRELRILRRLAGRALHRAAVGHGVF